MFKNLGKYLILPVMITLIAAFILVSPVQADDTPLVDATPVVVEATQPPEQAGPADAVVEETASPTAPEIVLPEATEAPVSETAAPGIVEPTAIAATEEVAAGDEAPVIEVTPVAEEDTTILEAVDALTDSDVQLVDSDGNPIVMAESASIDAVKAADPYFTVGAIKYSFLKSDGVCPAGTENITCFKSISNTPIQDALNYMAANNKTPTDGKLYIEADNYDEDVEVNGTLNGVKGLKALVGLGTVDDMVVINGRLYIHDTKLGFTVTNIIVNNSELDGAAITITNNAGSLKLEDVGANSSGTGSGGISISGQTGAVELNRVTADGNDYFGADIKTNGSVKVTNSSFDNNLNDVGTQPIHASLEITATGTVTLTGNSVSKNKGSGAIISSPTSTVTIINSAFSNNDTAEIDMNDGSSVGLDLTANIVSINGLETDFNGSYGLKAKVNTSFTGTVIYSMNNGDDGANINACWETGDGDIFCDNSGAGTVTLKNFLSFSINAGDGLSISAKGAITLLDSYSGGNTGVGFRINNSLAPSPATISLSKLTSMSNSVGFDILSKGAVSINSYLAIDNSGDGLSIDNTFGTGVVTITNASGIFNETANNGGNGFIIRSKGAVSITNFDSYQNVGIGGDIDNSTGSAAPVTLTILPISNAWANGVNNNGVGGLLIRSSGAVSITKVNADNNNGYGAQINNIPVLGTAAGMPVTINLSSFTRNEGTGLKIDSKGAVTLTNTQVSDNSVNYEALVNGKQYSDMLTDEQTWVYTTAVDTEKVTVIIESSDFNPSVWFTDTNYQYIEGSYQAGSDGYLEWTFILPDAAGTTYFIHLGSNNTKNIGDYSLKFYTGDTAPSSYTPEPYPLANGVVITNSTGANAAVSITNTKETYYGNNSGTSFTITASGPVTITNAVASDNGVNGLDITAKGLTSLNNVDASENGGFGLYINNQGPTSTGGINITNTGSDYNNFSNNGSYGISILSYGAVKIVNINAESNNGAGLSINNQGTKATGGVSITNLDNNFNLISNNLGNGITIYSNGAVILVDTDVNSNQGGGLFINNIPTTVAAVAVPVTITASWFNSNQGTGVLVFSKGAVTITDSQACNNSVNYQVLSDGDWWTDNLTDNQVWAYTSNGDNQKVTIRIESANFNPSVWITDANGNQIVYSDGTEGAVALDNFVLGTAGTYNIHLGSDQQYKLASYQLWFHVGDTAPGFYTPHVSAADGFNIDNSAGTNAPVSIINKQENWNGNNSGSAVEILSSGAVTLTKLITNENGQDAVNIDNHISTAKSGVTLTNMDIYNNDGSGLIIRTKGAIAITNSHSNNNAANGFDLSNQYSDATAGVTITNAKDNFNDANENGGYGYTILTNGAVSVTNLNVYNNGSYGGLIDNAAAPSAAAVTVTTLSSSNSNDNNYTHLESNNGRGLEIQSRGAVTLKMLASQFNKDDGIVVNNVPTNPVWAAVPVTITDSWSLNNINTIEPDTEEDGILITTKGAVTLTYVRSISNDGFGVTINNTSSTSSAGVTLNSLLGYGNYFDSNNLGGLKILTNGAVTITNIRALENSGFGVLIDNSTGVGGVTIKQTGTWYGYQFSTPGNVFNNNRTGGLNIKSKGAVNVAFYQARDNYQGTGILIDAVGGTGIVTITGLTNDYSDNVSYNGGDGINITAKGAVSLSNLVTNNNHNGYGIKVDNALGTGTVLLKNIMSNGNSMTGVHVNSHGVVTLSDVQANTNSANYFLVTPGQQWIDNMTGDQIWFIFGTEGDVVTIEVQADANKFNPNYWITDLNNNFIDGTFYAGSGNSVSGTFTAPDDGDGTSGESSLYKIHLVGSDLLGYRLRVYTGTSAPDESYWADHSYAIEAHGVYVNNSGGVNAGVSYINKYNNWNGANSAENVKILSSGSVVLTNMELNDSYAGALYVDNTASTTYLGVTLTNVNAFNNNDNNPGNATIKILSDGAVTVVNSFEGDNNGYGYYIDNSTGASSPVSMTNIDINGNNNLMDGINIKSKGNVSLAGISNYGNGGNGITIDTTGGTLAKITLSTITSSDNQGSGLDIKSNGAVSLKDIKTNNNGGTGTSIVTAGEVSVSASPLVYNRFQSNGYNVSADGLNISSGGKVTVSSIWASNNSSNGLEILSINANPLTLSKTPIELKDITTNYNQQSGTNIISNGSAVTITLLNANNNHSYGLNIDQSSSPNSLFAITLNNLTTKDNGKSNGLDGINVNAMGSIKVNNFSSFGNGGSGAQFSNDNAGSTGTVTISNSLGTNYAIGNGSNGVVIRSNGAVIVTGLEVSSNSGNGLYINNSDVGASKPLISVTVTNVLSHYNQRNGIEVLSDGVINVKDSWSKSNSWNGFALDSYSNINVTGSTATGNNDCGIYVYFRAPAVLKLTNTTWFGNLRNPHSTLYRNLLRLGVGGTTIIS